MFLRPWLQIPGCWAIAFVFLSASFAQQGLPSPSAARLLLLPRRIVSGERATLAVLDVNGRLTPGVRVNFSDGEHLTTDATGRAVFVAPLNPGMIFGTIHGRPRRVASAILAPTEASTSSMEVALVPAFASLTDRIEIFGKGFCGDADLNQVKVAGRSALVLASSPVTLMILPPLDLKPGGASVEVSCAKREAPRFSLTFVELSLEADSSPLKLGERRELNVRVRGTPARVTLEAQNLAPAIADLKGGSPVTATSSGGLQNLAHFEVTGRKNGSFQIAIRLGQVQSQPH